MKRVFALAIIVPLLSIYTNSFAGENNSVNLKTVVIDAGHGGHDPGTVSSDKKIKESAINLEVALALGKKIETTYPGMKVIYTRKTDVFIPLATRADIANKNHADLFISIHVNSARRNSSAGGTETFVMGTDKSESNMEVCKRENSVILLEDDYSTTYQGFDPNNAESYIFFNLMQNAHFEQSIAMASLVQQNFKKGPITKSRGIKQAPLMVLWRTTMPSVLIEIGFLSNQSDRKILADKSKRTLIADDIFKAFCEFKKQYDSNLDFEEPESAPKVNQVKEVKQEVEEVQQKSEVKQEAEKVQQKSEVKQGEGYAIQLMAVSKKYEKDSPVFKGIKNVERKYVNGIYKYSVGNFSTKEEASKKLKEIKKLFPDSFVVKN